MAYRITTNGTFMDTYYLVKNYDDAIHLASMMADHGFVKKGADTIVPMTVSMTRIETEEDGDE